MTCSEEQHQTMLDCIFHARTVAQVVRCAALFSLADHLAEGPVTAKQVATAESLDADGAFRLMRACVAFGLMTIDGSGRFSATPMLMTLRRNAPGSLRDMAISQCGLGHWAPWGLLDTAIRTGQPQARAALGCEFWEYYASTKGAEEANAFNRFLSGFFASINTEAAGMIDTKSVGFAVDVGGATGSLIQTLVQANSALRGAVLDIPRIAPEAQQAIIAQGLQDRLTFIGGDFFREVPAADLYLLKHVLHDWPDEACLSILQTSRRAARPGAKLILLEIAEEENTPSTMGAGSDLLMLTLVGGKERTAEAFKTLLAAAGFRFRALKRTSTPVSLIEAVAV